MNKIIIYKGRFSSDRCSACGGSGSKKCPRCDATGTFTDGSECYYCKGVGYFQCEKCKGTGLV